MILFHPYYKRKIENSQLLEITISRKEEISCSLLVQQRNISKNLKSKQKTLAF